MLHWQHNRHTQPLQLQLRGLDVLAPAGVSKAGSTAFEPGAKGTSTAPGTHNVLNALARLAKRQAGQTMAEYAVVLGALVLAVVGIISILSDAIVNRLGSVASTIIGLAP
jgi:Flp pilus assembly pilin Flp